MAPRMLRGRLRTGRLSLRHALVVVGAQVDGQMRRLQHLIDLRLRIPWRAVPAWADRHECDGPQDCAAQAAGTPAGGGFVIRTAIPWGAAKRTSQKSSFPCRVRVLTLAAATSSCDSEDVSCVAATVIRPGVSWLQEPTALPGATGRMKCRQTQSSSINSMSSWRGGQQKNRS